MNILREMDTELFLWINSKHSLFWDRFFWIVSYDFFVYPFLLLTLVYYRKKYSLSYLIYFVLFLLVGVLISDQMANLFKQVLVCRLRPTHDPFLKNYVHIVNGYVGGMYGFYSAHASNSVFALFFTWLRFGQKNKLLFFFVMFLEILISYSRIYLGVHYPSDILAGWCMGMFILFVTGFLWNKFFKS